MIRGSHPKVKKLFWTQKHSDQQTHEMPSEKKKTLGRMLWRGLYGKKAELRLPTFQFLDIQYKEKSIGYRYPRHAHSRFGEFYFVDRGEVTLHFGRKQIVLRAGQGILILPGHFHSIVGAPQKPANILTIHYQSPDLLKRIPAIKVVAEKALDLNAQAQHFLRPFIESLNRHKQPGLRAAIGFLEFLILLVENEGPQPEEENLESGGKPHRSFAAQVEKLIFDHVGEHLTLAWLAQQLGSSVSGLSHRYRDEAGETVKQAILRCRLEKAKDYLREPSRSVKEVAHLTGFVSSSALSTVFRKIEGSTPGEYQRSLIPSLEKAPKA